LQGKKTLVGCLKDYLAKEVLNGNNQYYCENCDAKLDATRCVKLKKLPPVLNLSLNRYIFDL
jgi:ubiquitin carboxyl-terminal hydrolase 48